MFFDPMYFLFLAPALLLAFRAQMRVKSTYAEASKMPSNLSGAAAVRYVLDHAGLNDVTIEQIPGQLSDHYDPREKVLRLSADVYSQRSLAAVGIAAHEAGHAIQDARHYAPLIIRNAAVPAANFGSGFSMTLFFIGLVAQWHVLMTVGIALFGCVVFFQLVNLPVEFNASTRAKEQLVTLGVISPEQLVYVRKVLDAAAWTYVAATLQSVLTLLYLLMVRQRATRLTIAPSFSRRACPPRRRQERRVNPPAKRSMEYRVVKMPMPRCLQLAACIVVLVLVTSAEAQARPNIVLLLADDQRPDTIHALGNDRIDTPNLDRLVAEGTSFRRAVTAYPICLQSRIELMTGCTIFHAESFAPRKGAANEIVPWAEALRRAGYRTWHVGKWHNAGTPRDWGYEETRGMFTSSRTKPEPPATDYHGRPVTGYTGYVFKTDDGKVETEKGIGLTPDITRHFADAAIELVERKSSEPFFLHVNFTAPHDPLLWPPGFEKRYHAADMAVPRNFLPEHPFDHGNLRGRDELLFAWPRTEAEVRDELACYYAVISHLDAQIGRILEALDRTGQADNTIVIFSSDQGLGVGSHGLRGKQNMYEHTIDVPLVVRGPGVRRDVRTDAQVYLRDLYPTTCEAAGVAVPANLDGRSFWPILEGREKEGHPFIIGYFRDSQRMIRDDRWKLIEYPEAHRTQLFDLVADPDELNDLSNDGQYAPTIAKLHEQLHTWLREHGDVQSKTQ